VATQFASTNKAAADTDPSAAYMRYLIGVAADPVAADHDNVKDPSAFAVTPEIPENVGAVVLAIDV